MTYEFENAVVGDGATACGYSDNKAATIVARTAKTITIQYDKATILNGPNSGEADALVATPGGFCAHVSGTQRWATERDENGSKDVYSLRKTRTGAKRWVLKGAGANQSGVSLIEGRSHYYDYNF